MSREAHLLLQDIIESGEAIEAYVSGLDYAAFNADQLRVDAVARRFEIIGEAVKKLPAELTAEAPEVPWRASRASGISWPTPISTPTTPSFGTAPRSICLICSPPVGDCPADFSAQPEAGGLGGR